jgi:hypothetical protein
MLLREPYVACGLSVNAGNEVINGCGDAAWSRCVKRWLSMWMADSRHPLPFDSPALHAISPPASGRLGRDSGAQTSRHDIDRIPP